MRLKTTKSRDNTIAFKVIVLTEFIFKSSEVNGIWLKLERKFILLRLWKWIEYF